jgi:hypothetical protein
MPRPLYPRYPLDGMLGGPHSQSGREEVHFTSVSRNMYHDKPNIKANEQREKVEIPAETQVLYRRDTWVRNNTMLLN